MMMFDSQRTSFDEGSDLDRLICDLEGLICQIIKKVEILESGETLQIDINDRVSENLNRIKKVYQQK